MSNNLNIPDMTEGQTLKYVTFNDFKGASDAALTEILDLTFVSGNVSPTVSQMRNTHIFRCTNVTVAGRALTIPLAKKPIFVYSDIANTQPLRVNGATSRRFYLMPGEGVYLYYGAASNTLYPSGYPLQEQVCQFNYANPTAGSRAMRYVVQRPLFTLTGLPGSTVIFDTAPVSTATWAIRKNETNIGTINYTNGSTTTTITVASGQSFVPGDRFDVIATNAITVGATSFDFVFNTYD